VHSGLGRPTRLVVVLLLAEVAEAVVAVVA